jgi:cobalamin biosynthesis protein CobT
MDDSMDRSSVSDEQEDMDLMGNGDEYEDGTEQSENDQSNEYGSDNGEESEDGNDDQMDDDDVDGEELGKSNSAASLNDSTDEMKQIEHNLLSSVEAAKDFQPLEFAAAELAADISAKFPAVKTFFSQQLRALLIAFNERAAPAEAENWFVVVNNRSGALSLNMLDIWYINSGSCKKARSRVEVALMSNHAPTVKQSHRLPSEVLYLAARENRERLLISQVSFYLMFIKD